LHQPFRHPILATKDRLSAALFRRWLGKRSDLCSDERGAGIAAAALVKYRTRDPKLPRQNSWR